MAPLPKSLKELCTPAFFYFVVSMISLIVMVLGNLGNTSKFNLGLFSVYVPNVTFIFIVQFFYVLFWTWILNLICKDNRKGFAWFLVLIPFILSFLLIGVISTKEGAKNMGKKMIRNTKR
uniref:Uncharacterized protein n=1 Tax=viral metagenome TaxID=1070528 RepID=A0A6C0KXK7_9ZZZZ